MQNRTTALTISLILHLSIIAILIIIHYSSKSISYQITKKDHQIIIASLVNPSAKKVVTVKPNTKVQPQLAQFNVRALIPIPSHIEIDRALIARQHSQQQANKTIKKTSDKKETKLNVKKAHPTSPVKTLENKQQQLKVQKVSGEKYNALVNFLYQRINQYKRYPKLAYKLGIEGDVKVSFTLLPNGQIDHLTIKHSSHSDVLDLAAIDTIKKAQPFRIASKYLSVAQNFNLVIHYQL
ncbi:TonB family protein [Thiotrichales bacterium 19S3-7]|nr:TonB family protein [Thiotrichales bacterium 19S3-7]MCF6801634.1 TonB family protein [Thiotrichales bacterium 19S3-11]